MAGSVNKVILVGRLGADPDVRYGQSGNAIVRFNLATDERVPGGEGNWEERTEWHRVVVFGKLAENCGNYLAKGRLVYVEGRLQTRQWEDQQGQKRSTTEIVAREVVFLSSPTGGGGAERGEAAAGGGGGEPPRGGRGQGGEKGGQGARREAPSRSGGGAPPPRDDDIPF